MEDAKATATTIALLFAPILQITAGVVRAHKDAIHNALKHAGQVVLHSVQNHVAWVVLHSAPNRVVWVVQMVVSASAEAAALHRVAHYAEESVIILVEELVILYVRGHAFLRIHLVARGHVMALAPLHVQVHVDHFVITLVKA